jgi:alpha-1,3-rhamnosyl/mannosyltransferase
VRRTSADVGLVIVGADPPPPEWLREARLLGRVTDEELADLYSAAACLVFPSRYEGFGLPVLEAMACGCPVAAFRNSSVPEVAGEAAHLVADGDARALGAAVVEILSVAARARSMRKAGLRRARAFSWARTAQATARVYESLLG